MRSLIVALAGLPLLAACTSSKAPDAEPASLTGQGTPDSKDLARLDTLSQWMSGTFDSADQAKADRDYFVIQLHMVPIWPDRTDGRWLYVEQAMGQQPDKPYRQRVYRLTSKGAGRFSSEVFELPGDPLNYAGGWRDTSLLSALSPEQLLLRDGCAITLIDTGPAFTGSTGETSCISTLRGAAYATSEVLLSSDQLVSWDRGFDKDGKQVWGAIKGGYIFKKKQGITPRATPAR